MPFVEITCTSINVRARRMAYSTSPILPRLHNAVVGDASDNDSAPTAEYMRRVVLLAMSARLNRTVYDRSRPCKDNRTRSAFGCYHCHRLKQDDEPAVDSE